MALRKNVLQEDNILCELYADVRSDVSDNSDNKELYSAEGKKLEDRVLSLLGGTLGLNHHIYQDNYYNSVRLAQTLLDRNMRVCGTIRANRGISRDLEGEGAAHKKRSETRYICKFCVVPLHKGSCFEKYHSVTNY